MSKNGVNESPPCQKFNEIFLECKDLLIFKKKKSNNHRSYKNNFEKERRVNYFCTRLKKRLFMCITTLIFTPE